MTPAMPSPAVARFQYRPALLRMPMRGRVALAAIIAIALVAVSAPVFPLASPTEGDLSNRLLGFGEGGFVLGTDALGRDILSRLVYGTRTSLIISVVPILIAAVIGVTIGMISGLTSRSWLRALLMRGVDILFAFPAVILAIMLSIAFGAGMVPLIIAVTLVWISPIARITETEVLRVRDLDFVLVARSSGAAGLEILLRQILPVSLPAVSAYATSLVGASIAITGGLGFLGLGVPAPAPELGAMLSELQNVIYSNPLQSVLPVFVILTLSMLFPVLGDGIRDVVTGRAGDEQ